MHMVVGPIDVQISKVIMRSVRLAFRRPPDLLPNSCGGTSFVDVLQYVDYSGTVLYLSLVVIFDFIIPKFIWDRPLVQPVLLDY